MSNLLKKYVETLLEATLRPNRIFYGANVTKSGNFFSEVVEGLLKSKKLMQKELSKQDFAEFQTSMQDLTTARDFLDKKFANRFIAKNIRETSSQVTLSINLISRSWTGQELKSANKGMVPAEFEKGVQIATLTLPSMKSVSWLVAKQEELSAETNALDNFNQTSFGDGQPKTVTVKSTQSGLSKVFKNVNGLVKSSDKTGHADFYFVDVDGNIIRGSGISHKAKGASDKSVAERYAGITRLMQNLAKKSAAINIEESLRNKNILLTEAEEFASSQETIDMISTFIEEAKKYYKSQALAGVEVAGFIKSIDIKAHKNELETMLYGPDKSDCTMLVISQVDKMTLKKVGKNYELDVGGDGKVFIRPDIPNDAAYKPIFVCRFGTGGSTFTFTKKESDVLKRKKHLPSYIKFNKGIAYIPVRLYVSPAVRSPSKDAVDIAKLSE